MNSNLSYRSLLFFLSMSREPLQIYHLQTRKEVPPAKSATLVEEGPLRATIEFEYQITECVAVTGLAWRHVCVCISCPKIAIAVPVVAIYRQASAADFKF